MQRRCAPTMKHLSGGRGTASFLQNAPVSPRRRMQRSAMIWATLSRPIWQSARMQWLAAQPPQLWSSMALHQLLAPFGALIMHASLVRIGGRAVLFTAPCGTGKSTQARLWAELRGAEVLNGDKAGLRFMGGELIAFGVPICGTSGICKNMALPVAAIVELSQAKATAIRRLAPSAAVQAVSANIYAERCVPWQNALETVLQIVGSVPVLHLACTPDESAIAALEQVLGEETK